MTLAQIHDRLLGWASSDLMKEELLRARKRYFDRFGEPNEEDKSFESRMNGFLDWYLYNYAPEGGGDNVIERFIKAEGAAIPTDELNLYRTLGKNTHSIFEVRRIKKDEIRLRDIFTAGDHDVTERRTLAGLEKGDLIEARLMPYDSRLFFSGAFLYHPPAVRKIIFAQVKKLKKAAGKGQMPDVEAFLGQLSKAALKMERYRNVKVESIYSFE